MDLKVLRRSVHSGTSGIRNGIHKKTARTMPRRFELAFE
jgi:hypothetical protein